MLATLPHLPSAPRASGFVQGGMCNGMNGSISRTLLSYSEGRAMHFRKSVGKSQDSAEHKNNFELPPIRPKLQPQQPDSPTFDPPAGWYDEKVIVALRAIPKVKVKYTVEEVVDNTFPFLTPTMHGHIFRKPFVLDKPGVYTVQATAIADEWGLDRSPMNSAVYTIRPKAPWFTTKGGTYKDVVAVAIKRPSGTAVHYTIISIEQGREVANEPVSRNSCCYQEPIVLDRGGVYMVKAASFAKTAHGFLSSVVVTSELYKVESKTVGEHLCALPMQMIQGVMRMSGVTEATLVPKLQAMRNAIATAANTVKSSVQLELLKKDHQKEDDGNVHVGFSVEVGPDQNADNMVVGLVDPSLVKRFAAIAGVAVEKFSVEAKHHNLDEVLLSLGWKFPGSAQDGNGVQDYLDGSCLVYSEEHLIEIVDYRGAHSIGNCKNGKSSVSGAWSAGRGENASIMHSGDVMESNGGSHVIRLRLSALPNLITDCFFALSAYYCRDLSRFEQPTMRLFDALCPKHQLCSYKLEDAGSAAAVVICAMSREKGTWKVRGFSKTCDATVRDYTSMENIIRPIQDIHFNWRRRKDIILIAKLWHTDRALPCGIDQEKDDVLMPLFELPCPLFRAVVKFL